MSTEQQKSLVTYTVVINHEEQYSLWPINLEIPVGWKAVSKSGTKTECLDYIRGVWSDMRPLSLRKHMTSQSSYVSAHTKQLSSPRVAATIADKNVLPMDDLVKRLSEGAYPVSASEFHKSAEELRQSIHRGYVYVKFTDTKGGTQLGVRLDRGATDLSHADFQQASGKIDLVGDLNLNGIDIRCIANLDLATLQGTGRVEIVEH